MRNIPKAKTFRRTLIFCPLIRDACVGKACVLKLDGEDFCFYVRSHREAPHPEQAMAPEVEGKIAKNPHKEMYR